MGRRAGGRGPNSCSIRTAIDCDYSVDHMVAWLLSHAAERQSARAVDPRRCLGRRGRFGVVQHIVIQRTMPRGMNRAAAGGCAGFSIRAYSSAPERRRRNSDVTYAPAAS